MSEQPTPYETGPIPDANASERAPASSGGPALPPLAQQPLAQQPLPTAYGAWPAPIAPLGPMPVQSLSYGYGPPSSRPGILTAVAVVSIVLASLSLLASLWGGLFSIGMYAFSQMKLPAPPTATSMSTSATTTGGVTVHVHNASGSASVATPSAPSQPPAITLLVGPRGMEEPERRIVIGGLQQARSGMEPLPPSRVKMLDALLADSGQDMFGFRGPALTYNNIAGNVSDVGQLPSVSRTRTGADYYVIGSGRMEIYDDHALFAPSGGGDVVRVSEEDLAVSVAGAGLSPRDVQAVVSRVQTMTGQRLAPAQVAALRTFISNPGQGLISPRTPGGLAPQQQITQAMANSGGLTVMTTSGGLMLGPDGTITNTWSMSGGGAFGGPMAAPFKIPPAAALMTGLESLAGLLLGVWLLVCGILTLRQHRWGRKGHLLWAVLKIPLVIVAGIGWAWMFYSMQSTAMGGAAGAGPAASFTAMMQAIGYIVVGLIYPIALLIVFTRSRVREYYNPVGG